MRFFDYWLWLWVCRRPIRLVMSFDCTENDCCLQNKTVAKTMILLDAAGKIYMIEHELNRDDEEREPVATWEAEQMPPQCNVECTRMKFETRAVLDRNWRFYLLSILNFKFCYFPKIISLNFKFNLNLITITEFLLNFYWNFLECFHIFLKFFNLFWLWLKFA